MDPRFSFSLGVRQRVHSQHRLSIFTSPPGLVLTWLHVCQIRHVILLITNTPISSQADRLTAPAGCSAPQAPGWCKRWWKGAAREASGCPCGKQLSLHAQNPTFSLWLTSSMQQITKRWLCLGSAVLLALQHQLIHCCGLAFCSCWLPRLARWEIRWAPAASSWQQPGTTVAAPEHEDTPSPSLIANGVLHPVALRVLIKIQSPKKSSAQYYWFRKSDSPWYHFTSLEPGPKSKKSQSSNKAQLQFNPHHYAEDVCFCITKLTEQL